MPLNLNFSLCSRAVFDSLVYKYSLCQNYIFLMSQIKNSAKLQGPPAFKINYEIAIFVSPVANFINILQANFSYKNTLPPFFTYM